MKSFSEFLFKKGQAPGRPSENLPTKDTFPETLKLLIGENESGNERGYQTDWLGQAIRLLQSDSNSYIRNLIADEIPRRLKKNFEVEVIPNPNPNLLPGWKQGNTVIRPPQTDTDMDTSYKPLHLDKTKLVDSFGLLIGADYQDDLFGKIYIGMQDYKNDEVKSHFSSLVSNLESNGIEVLMGKPNENGKIVYDAKLYNTWTVLMNNEVCRIVIPGYSTDGTTLRKPYVQPVNSPH